MSERDPLREEGGHGAGDGPALPDPAAGDGDATPPPTETKIVTDADQAAASDPDATGPIPLGPRGRIARSVSVRPVRAPIRGVRRSLSHTQELRESLARKEAEANDLRASIDRLRQELDTDRTVVTEPPPRRRPWFWVALLALALLLAWLLSQCAGTLFAGSTQRSAPSGSPVNSPAPSGGPSATPGTSPEAGRASPGAGAGTPNAPGGSVRTTPMPWQGTRVITPPGIATTGPGVSEPGSDTTYALDADGSSVNVFERVRLATPAPQLSAQLPALTGLRGELGAAKLKVRGLQVELDGQPVAPTAAGAGWTARRADGQPITTAVLRYQVSSAVLRLVPARQGRYAALLTPLTVAEAGGGKVTNLRVLGSGLVAVSCPTAKGADVLCGTTNGSTATVTVPQGVTPVVQLVLDRERR